MKQHIDVRDGGKLEDETFSSSTAQRPSRA
jgi:hypothetical protein